MRDRKVKKRECSRKRAAKGDCVESFGSRSSVHLSESGEIEVFSKDEKSEKEKRVKSEVEKLRKAQERVRQVRNVDDGA